MRNAVAVAMVVTGVLGAGQSLAQTAVERGKALVSGVAACGNCHSRDATAKLDDNRLMAGGFVFKEEPFTAYASNITPDPETGIGRWSAQQIARAIR